MLWYLNIIPISNEKQCKECYANLYFFFFYYYLLCACIWWARAVYSHHIPLSLFQDSHFLWARHPDYCSLICCRKKVQVVFCLGKTFFTAKCIFFFFLRGEGQGWSESKSLICGWKQIHFIKRSRFKRTYKIDFGKWDLIFFFFWNAVFYLLFKKCLSFTLEGCWFAVWCWFLVYISVDQPSVNICSLPLSPSQPHPIPPGHHRATSWAPGIRPQLSTTIYYTHGGVCVKATLCVCGI